MEAECTSITATPKNQLTITDLDDDSLGMIFNKLPYIDRNRIGSVCQRWYAISEEHWCTYCSRLIIAANMTIDEEAKNMLVNMLQRSGPYFKEIIFPREDFDNIPMGTIKWIAELCPKVKRLNAGFLKLNKDDWLACRNLETFIFKGGLEQSGDLRALFRSNKRLRRLGIMASDWLTASDFDDLDPGQLNYLQLIFCSSFEFTVEVMNKLAESLLELRYITIYGDPVKLQHIGKLRNLRSLDLHIFIHWRQIDFIADISKNCRKLEGFLLAVFPNHAYDENVFAPLFNLPYLKRLVIIVNENEMTREVHDKLLQRGAQLQIFIINRCATCTSYMDGCCDQHAGASNKHYSFMGWARSLPYSK